MEELEKETQLSKEPGYRSRYDEGYDERTKPRRQEKKTSESKPSNESSADGENSQSDSDTEPQPTSDSTVDLNLQSEVETRIDIPRPNQDKFSPSGISTKQPAESLALEMPDASGSHRDGDDVFGKGIF